MKGPLTSQYPLTSQPCAPTNVALFPPRRISIFVKLGDECSQSFCSAERREASGTRSSTAVLAGAKCTKQSITFAEPTPVYEMKVRARRGRWGTAWFKAPRRGLVAVRKSAQPALCATHRAIYLCHEDFDYTLFYLCSSSAQSWLLGTPSQRRPTRTSSRGRRRTSAPRPPTSSVD